MASTNGNGPINGSTAAERQISDLVIEAEAAATRVRAIPDPDPDEARLAEIVPRLAAMLLAVRANAALSLRQAAGLRADLKLCQAACAEQHDARRALRLALDHALPILAKARLIDDGAPTEDLADPRLVHAGSN